MQKPIAVELSEVRPRRTIGQVVKWTLWAVLLVCTLISILEPPEAKMCTGSPAWLVAMSVGLGLLAGYLLRLVFLPFRFLKVLNDSTERLLSNWFLSPYSPNKPPPLDDF